MGNYDVMLLTKTKILETVYFKSHVGYDVVCLGATPTAAVGVQRGVGLVMRYRIEVCGIDSMLFHRLNVVSCEIISGIQ